MVFLHFVFLHYGLRRLKQNSIHNIELIMNLKIQASRIIWLYSTVEVPSNVDFIIISVCSRSAYQQHIRILHNGWTHIIIVCRINSAFQLYDHPNIDIRNMLKIKLKNLKLFSLGRAWKKCRKSVKICLLICPLFHNCTVN